MQNSNAAFKNYIPGIFLFSVFFRFLLCSGLGWVELCTYYSLLTSIIYQYRGSSIDILSLICSRRGCLFITR